MNTENINHVPDKLWNSFKSDVAKHVFNNTFEKAVNNVDTFNPNTPIGSFAWKTICWNIASLAAWSVDGDEIHKEYIIEDE